MREEPLMTHDQMVTKWMENPDFWKAVSELNAQYADLDETLSKRKTNSQVQAGTTRKVNRSAAEIHRLENPRSSTGTNFRNLEKASALLKIFKRQKISCLALSSRQLWKSIKAKKPLAHCEHQ